MSSMAMLEQIAPALWYSRGRESLTERRDDRRNRGHPVVIAPGHAFHSIRALQSGSGAHPKRPTWPRNRGGESQHSLAVWDAIADRRRRFGVSRICGGVVGET